MRRRLVILLVWTFLPLNLYGMTIWDACRRGDERSVLAALQSGVSPDAPEQRTGERPLHIACSNGSLTLAFTLIERGADVDARNVLTGRTPLQAAIALGSTNVAAFLLRNGASVFRKDAVGYSCLHQAVLSGRVAMARVVLEAIILMTNASIPLRHTLDESANWYGNTPLHVAAGTGNADMIRFLLKFSPSLNLRNDEEGDTPLHAAVQSGSLECVKLLVESGAVTDVRNYRRLTPEDLAEDRGLLRIAEYLRGLR